MENEFISSIVFGFGVVFLYQTLLFVVAQLLQRNDIVDIGWGIGFVVVFASLIIKNGINAPASVVFVLILLWAVRLALHVGFRNKDITEDFRYAKWRKEWGKWVVLRAYFQVFLLQGFFMGIVSAPFHVLFFQSYEPFWWFFLVGVIIFAYGFAFETRGDMELRKFQQDASQKGTILDTGLWSITRHPNYFGEAVLWWGIFVMTLPVTIGVISPVIMTFLLRYISGVPMLERRMKSKPGFEAYAKNVPVFLPKKLWE
jgi:steroid 5-alpha reductase family enzyme